jgi:hypothetical protein
MAHKTQENNVLIKLSANYKYVILEEPDTRDG